MYEKVKQEAQTNYYSATLLRALISLNADTASSQSANGAGTVRYLVRNGMAIEYYIDNGDVLIHKLHFDDSLQADSGNQAMGVYKVQYDGSAWGTSGSSHKQMNLKHKWNGAHYAAVSGKFRSKGSAGQMLVRHIEKSYGGTEILPRDIPQMDNFYSLYWINNKEHGALPSVDGLTSLIQQAASASESVNWLVHGEGAKTFQRALEILQNTPSLSRFEAKDEEIVRNLRNKMSGQKVFFSNPVGANPDKLEKLCNVVGLTYVDSNTNPRNLKTAAGRENSWNEIKRIGAASTGTGVTAVSLKESGIFTIQKQGGMLSNVYEAAISNPTLAAIGTAGLCTAAAFVVGKTQATKWASQVRAIHATASSTFGRGNEYWYDSDEDLLEQLSA
ncbi:hypothetical protein [Microbulbifer sp. GL-2]|uniref:hypothetical protein n=1 Tax=Microbulbifer sp. GL-2 TaxID=2591606 RepID=UPI00116563AD|nr:hypothetical protein [Microbulbifer sp. GL-2]BBM01951.1 hypothetical protein GL2_20250 [Microbulbifer sp. GL-2]